VARVRPSLARERGGHVGWGRVAALSELRIGLGVDAHAFADDVPLVLGGVRLDHPRGLAGHSDGDVIAHALTDALLGAADLGDIGSLFPSDDERWRGADSLELLRIAYTRVREAGWVLVNADCVLVGEQPRIAAHRDEMATRLAEALSVPHGRVTVRATTTDGLGFTGRGEGLAAQAVALLSH
jgi:2-C-methyl-D-erythritol 2,4-cyclodiphosphate synthase